MMIGGIEETLESARLVLDVIAANLHLMVSVADEVVPGVRTGAGPLKVLEVFFPRFGSRRMLDREVPSIVECTFGGGTPVDPIRKDLGIIYDVARSLGVPMATGEEASRVFYRAVESAYGDNDMIAIVRPLEGAAGIEVEKPVLCG